MGTVLRRAARVDGLTHPAGRTDSALAARLVRAPPQADRPARQLCARFTVWTLRHGDQRAELGSQRSAAARAQRLERRRSLAREESTAQVGVHKYEGRQLEGGLDAELQREKVGMQRRAIKRCARVPIDRTARELAWLQAQHAPARRLHFLSTRGHEQQQYVVERRSGATAAVGSGQEAHEHRPRAAPVHPKGRLALGKWAVVTAIKVVHEAAGSGVWRPPWREHLIRRQDRVAVPLLLSLSIRIVRMAHRPELRAHGVRVPLRCRRVEQLILSPIPTLQVARALSRL